MAKIVNTDLGVISGTETANAFLFKGIPYAKPPVGDFRFRAPQPIEPWNGVLFAERFGAICPQSSLENGGFYHKEFYSDLNYVPEMCEDCLYLNIWAPKNAKEKCPVAIWIHGGAFMSGFGSEIAFDGEEYAKRGVVLVTINYRLGFFGFFCHPELTARDGYSGNYGLLDQMAAIDWVRAHIGSFGGDEEKITVLGQSAGAASVNELLCSPRMHGKIHRAIMQSGGGYKSPLQIDLTLAQLQSIHDDFLKKRNLTFAEFSKLPAEQIVTLGEELTRYAASNINSPLILIPVIDGNTIPDQVDRLIETGKTLRIPTLVGSTKHDITVDADGIEDCNKSSMYISAVEWAQRHNEQGIASYVYHFRHELPGDKMGAFHSSELWYIFGTLDRSWRPMNKVDTDLSQEMIESWVQFIKTGNPGWAPCVRLHPFVKTFGG